MALILKKSAITVGKFTKTVAIATWAEARRQQELIVLKRRFRSIQDSLVRLERDTGARLLVSGQTPRDDAERGIRFGQLNQAYILANQAGQAGDKAKKAEAIRLATELQMLYAEHGRRAINQLRNKAFAFEGDSEVLAQSDQFQADTTTITNHISQLEEQWTTKPPKAKREVVLGIAACVAMMCAIGVGMGFALTARRNATQPVVLGAVGGEEGKKEITLPPTPKINPPTILDKGPPKSAQYVRGYSKGYDSGVELCNAADSGGTLVFPETINDFREPGTSDFANGFNQGLAEAYEEAKKRYKWDRILKK